MLYFLLAIIIYYFITRNGVNKCFNRTLKSKVTKSFQNAYENILRNLLCNCLLRNALRHISVYHSMVRMIQLMKRSLIFGYNVLYKFVLLNLGHKALLYLVISSVALRIWCFQRQHEG